MANEKYTAGDKATISGVVTGVSDNAGRVEYTIAVEDSDVEYDRPLNLPPAVDRELAEADGHAEYLKALSERPNYRRDEDVPALSADADKVREETDTPDPRKKEAGNASIDAKDVKATPGATTKSTTSNK